MAFNFQPIINPSAIQQKTNNDFQLSKAGLGSIFNGVGGFAESIAKLGQWKKTMDEREERLKQKRAWEDAYNAAKGNVDSINGEQFDEKSVDPNPFKIAATEVRYIAPEGYKRTKEGFQIADDSDTELFDFEGIRNGNYEDRGFSYVAPTEEGFDEEGYSKAVADARGKWEGDRSARLKAAQGELDKYGWNDMGNPAVVSAWEEYVRNGNSELITGLQNAWNADLQRKAVEQQLKDEKAAEDKKSRENEAFNLQQTFNKALDTYNAMKTEDSENGKIFALSGKSDMQDAINRLDRLGYDTTELKQQMEEAVGAKVGSIDKGIAKKKAAAGAAVAKKSEREKVLDELLEDF